MSGRVWGSWLRAVRSLLRRSQHEGELDFEMRFHLEMEAEELARAEGLPAAEARRRAMLAFGGVDKYKEQVRRQRASHWLEQVGADVRYAARSLRKHPTYTFATVATLALGIAGAAAVFTVLDAVVLRPLPYARAAELVRIQSPVPLVNPDVAWQLAEGEFQYFARETHSFASLGLYTLGNATVSLAGRGGQPSAERTGTALVSASMFDVLKIAPMLGRPITSQDNLSELPQVVLLGHNYWKRQFAGDPSVVGSVVSVEGLPLQVVGVLAEGADLPEELAASGALHVDVWLPLHLDPAEPAKNHHVYRAIGRLKAGVSIEAAQSELSRLTARLPEALPSAYSAAFMQSTGFSTHVGSLRDDVVGGIARALWILFASVGIVLLIAGANVANLYVARVEARSKEIGIRSALGADAGRVLRHFLVEGMLISFCAGMTALALAYTAIRVLIAFSPAGVPRLAEVHVGPATYVFTAALCLCSSCLLALLALPRRRAAMEVLHEAGRATTASRRQRAFRGALVVSQVALSLVILMSAALLFQSFRKLTSVHPGIDPRGVIAFDVAVPGVRYNSFEAARAFHETLEQQLRSLPGVRAAGATSAFPFSGDDGCSGIRFTNPETGAETGACLPLTYVTPGYFKAVGIRVRGRGIEWTDAKPGNSVAVVSSAAAARLWPGRDPIGRRLGGDRATDGQTFTVVGVASDVLSAGLDKKPVESIYFPIAAALRNTMGDSRRMTIALATHSAKPQDLVPAIRRTLASIDPDVPPSHVVTLDDIIAKSTARASFSTLLLGLASIIALLLCALGIYGITSYLVMQRSAEIGIRMALGAGQLQVGKLVLLHTVKLAVVGVALGALGAVFVTRLLGSQLFRVSPTDPLTLVIVSLALILLALVATYAPARRAMRVDPVRLLHG